MQNDTYVHPFQSQAWSAPNGSYHALSNWNGAHEAQVVATSGYWANCPFDTRSNWRNNQDTWCQENWCHSADYFPGKENKNSNRCGDNKRCKRGRQRRNPPSNPKCNAGACKQPRVSKAQVVAVPAQVPTPKAAAEAQESATLAPQLLPEHLSLLAPFLSSNIDSGSWRATCRDAKEAMLPNGPHAAMLSTAGQAALVGLEKRKKLQDILVNARKLVSGLNFR
eukprot:gnl/MRDRNA2_/MRDRNA2_91746_c0_seq1.p1 gnl/MRDRNA2_/MRDRNA2_91746_c0~~gnl/MRDRNA2_/MRDRNA2_91746_c0_seq1.p1  ORF type:complete len:223 (+),score=39.26 gnl/MRDRNA2_/MRDRNA2_91746_c0_seq1:99-767(+)